MKNKNLLRTLACLAVMALISPAAQAQFGGLKKLKQAAEKTTQEVTKPASSAPAAVSAPAAAAAPAAAPAAAEAATPTKYQPTPEAAAADSMATSDEVLPGYTRSVRDMHRFYEKLSSNKSRWLFTPYYDYQEHYIMHDKDSRSEQRINSMWYKLMSSLVSREFPDDPVKVADFVPVTANGVDGYVPIIEVVINAYSAAYIADPMSPRAFSYMVNLQTLYGFEAITFLEYYLEDETNGIVDKEAGKYMVETPHQLRLKQNNRAGEAFDLYKEYYPMEGARAYLTRAQERLKENIAAENWIDACVWYQVTLAALDLVKKNKDFEANRGDEILEAQLTEQRADYMEWARFAMLETAPARPMPATVSGTPELLAAATRGAQDAYGDQFVAVVMLDKKTDIIKHHQYPYPVIGRAIPIGIIYKPKGVKRDCYAFDYRQLQQMGSGAPWSGGMISSPIGQYTIVVDYQP